MHFPKSLSQFRALYNIFLLKSETYTFNAHFTLIIYNPNLTLRRFSYGPRLHIFCAANRSLGRIERHNCSSVLITRVSTLACRPVNRRTKLVKERCIKMSDKVNSSSPGIFKNCRFTSHPFKQCQGLVNTLSYDEQETFPSMMISGSVQIQS